MSWLIWFGSIYGRTTHKRNRYTQSARCICITSVVIAFKRFYCTGIISCVIASPVAFYYLHNWLLKYDYRISIDGCVYYFSCNSNCNNNYYHQFPGNKSSDCKPGEKFENGIDPDSYRGPNGGGF